ncbi:MAG TPA: hypothetical protein VFG05_06485 [Methylocella sp.]|nr:hypothetical protein [Methylocella sp.]
MTDEVSIKFIADISGLKDGMREAASAVQSTIGTLRSGAEQINAAFVTLSQAHLNASIRRIATVQTASSAELAAARQSEQAKYDIALKGMKEQSAIVRQLAQTSQISRQDELARLLALEAQREAIERQHLQFQQSTLQQGTTAYAAAQRRLEELSSQSALRRREIERGVTQQIYGDYKHSFEQAGSAISSSITGLITGQLKFRDAVRNVLTQLLHMFIQAKVKMVADWLAGVAAQTAATQASEAAKTAAVTAGTAARTGAQQTGATASMGAVIGGVLKSIMASAGETFAGIFGFLSPVMGPAAAGPAAAGQATVMAVGSSLASFDKGAWDLPADMVAKVHQGEMIIPAGPAAAFRSMMENGRNAQGTVNVHHALNFNVSAMDSRSVRQFFKDHGKTLMRTVNESVRTGAHIGLSRLGQAG